MIVASFGHQMECTPGGCSNHEKVDGPLLGGGIGLIVGSAVLGAFLAFRPDLAHVTIEPLVPGPPAAPPPMTRELMPTGLGTGSAARGMGDGSTSAITVRF
jgi:hypothetical protein